MNNENRQKKNENKNNKKRKEEKRRIGGGLEEVLNHIDFILNHNPITKWMAGHLLCILLSIIVLSTLKIALTHLR